MLVNVLVQSDLSAPANGFLQVTLDNGLPVGDLVAKFCEDKHIEDSSQYCLLNSENHVLDRKKPISYYGLQSGDKVIFGSVNEPKTPFQPWSFIAIIAVLFSVIGLVVCLGIHLGLTTVPDSYALVLDAGSTHTEIILYRWPGDKINNTGMVEQEISCGIKGGIGELTSGANVPSYLHPCLNKVQAKIPTESIDHAEIFFGATAGMRILKEKNDTLAEEILAETRKTLQSTGLKFEESHADILTGSVEGATGWLTVNYLNNNLLKQKPTWGALDLGGASTQISFELNETKTLPTKNESLIASFQIYGRNVKVFSKSFLCYGLVQLELRYRALLIMNLSQLSISSNEVSSPCQPVGYVQTFHSDQVFGSPCSPKLNNTEEEKNYTFAGTGNWEECHPIMKYILSESFCQEYSLRDCISLRDFPDEYLEELHFLGFSAFGHIGRSIGLGKNGTKEAYETQIKKVCKMTLAELQMAYDQISAKRLPLECFSRLYVLTLLSDVYKFNTESRWSNIEFGLKVEGKDLGWALGFMVNETQSIASAPTLYGMNTIAFTLLVLLLASFFLVGTGFVIHALKSRRSLNRTYSSLGISA